jgi:hypothetical protein
LVTFWLRFEFVCIQKPVRSWPQKTLSHLFSVDL